MDALGTSWLRWCVWSFIFMSTVQIWLETVLLAGPEGERASVWWDSFGLPGLLTYNLQARGAKGEKPMVRSWEGQHLPPTLALLGRAATGQGVCGELGWSGCLWRGPKNAGRSPGFFIAHCTLAPELLQADNKKPGSLVWERVVLWGNMGTADQGWMAPQWWPPFVAPWKDILLSHNPFDCLALTQCW